MGQFIADTRARANRARRIAITALLVGGGCTSGATRAEPTEVSCEHVRSHIAELQLEPRATPSEHAAQLALATRALGDEFLASCRSMPSAQRACIADATAAAAAFACSRDVDVSAGGAAE